MQNTHSFMRPRINLRFRIVRFLYKKGWFKKSRKLNSNPREILAKEIILNLLKNKDNRLYTNLFDASEKKRYIKNDAAEIYVIITEDTNNYHVIISNHNYFYDIELGVSAYKDIIKKFDRFLYNRRKNMELEMLDNINENLSKIRDRAKNLKKD